MNYTKGPWKLDDFNCIEDEYGNKLLLDCKVGLAWQNDDDKNLILAAPDMYRALKWLMDDLPKNRDWLNPDLERMLKHALCKAEGSGE